MRVKAWVLGEVESLHRGGEGKRVYAYIGTSDQWKADSIERVAKLSFSGIHVSTHSLSLSRTHAVTSGRGGVDDVPLQRRNHPRPAVRLSWGLSAREISFLAIFFGHL